MKSRAAVAFEPKKPLEIIEVDLDGPKAGEVLVEVRPRGSAILMNLRCPVPILRDSFQPFLAMRALASWWTWARA